MTEKKDRVFESGASRNSSEGKLGYEGFMHPLVTKRYAEFMHKNRKTDSGLLRAPDNWTKGIPIQALMESATRHFEDVRLHHSGFGEEAVENYLDSLLGVVFNIFGMVHAEEVLGTKTSKRDDRGV